MIPYRPGNSTEGFYFESKFCDRCERERKFREMMEDNTSTAGDVSRSACPILSATQSLGVDDPLYPAEWVRGDHNLNPRCTAFVSEDEARRKRKDEARRERKDERAKAKTERLKKSGQLSLWP